MQNLGLSRGTLELVPHDDNWSIAANELISRLRTRLGRLAKDICHVGSTSVTGICAKPIIDIAVAYECSSEEIISALAESEFVFRHDHPDNGGLLFVCHGSDPDRIFCHVHAVKYSDIQWRNYILFRDFLTAFPDAAKKYEKVKLELLNKFSDDRYSYTCGKANIISYFLRKALVWSYMGKDVHIEIDRPVGYIHKKENYSLTYPINYGYIPEVLGGDGEELDVYLLGVSEPVKEFDARVIAVVQRRNDIEDKLIAAPCGMDFSDSELVEATYFQEQYYDTVISKKFDPII